MEKAYLSSLGSRISSGTVCCNCEPWEQTYYRKWIGPSHGPVPWKCVEKLFFNKGLISSLTLLGKIWTLNLAIACGKGLPFFSWLQDQLWNSLLQLWTLRTNLLKWIGPSHGPVPWKFVEKLFFNKGLISSLTLLGKIWTLNLAIACGKGLPFFSWLQDQLWNSLLQLWTLRTNLLKWIGPSHGPVPWKCVEKLFFNKGLISSLTLLGKIWTLNLAIACGKGLPFFSWLQDQLWNSLLQLWTLRTNLLKWIGPSHGPVPWKCVEKLFFNKGLISSLTLLGKIWTLNLAIACGKGLPFFSWLQDQLWNSLLQLWTLRTNLLKWIGPSHGPVPWKFVEKLFFNTGLISSLILLGQGEKIFFRKNVQMFLHKHFFDKKNAPQDFLPQ